MPLIVLIIDDHPLVQQGVATALTLLADDVRVIAARDAEEGLALAADTPDLDLVLLDLALPDMSGFNLIDKLHERLPSLPVVVLSAHEEPENVRRAINAGAIGFVPKSAAARVLIDTLRQVLAGNVTVPLALPSSGPLVSNVLAAKEGNAALTAPDVARLTLRQLDVLSRVCQGKTNKQIATELDLSVKTVKAHVTALFRVLGVVNRTQALLVARQMGLTAH